LELLAGEMVKLTEHAGLSRESVRCRLVENDLKLWRRDMWCIPEVDSTYVAHMEDMLDLYAEAPDPGRPDCAADFARGRRRDYRIVLEESGVGPFETCRRTRRMSAHRGKPEVIGAPLERRD
jgi:hypothetical protein